LRGWTMIGYIKGTLAEIRTDCLLLDRDGIGFRIFVPAGLLSGTVHTGEELMLYTYLSVREDALNLYGFPTKDELEVFKLLLNVSGIGPKAALGVLSNISVDDLRFAVLTEDTKKLAKVPGIGKKTAAKLVLELKDSMKMEDLLPDADEGRPDNQTAAAEEGGAFTEAIQALVVLGYGRSEAAKAVRAAASETGSNDTQVLLKASLKHIY